MAAKGPPKPKRKELRIARVLEEWDSDPLATIELALIRGITLDQLGLSPLKLHAARVRFVQQAYAEFLFKRRGSFSDYAALYLGLGVVKPEEITSRPADHLALEGFAKHAKVSDDEDMVQKRKFIRTAVRRSLLSP